MGVHFKSVDEYIDFFPKEIKPVLETLRKTIKSEIPEAEEVISYNIPCYKVNDKYAVYFAGYKAHVSLYPFSSEMEKEIDVSEYKTSGKGTIQFSLDKPLPVSLIRKIVKAMVKRSLERNK